MKNGPPEHQCRPSGMMACLRGKVYTCFVVSHGLNFNFALTSFYVDGHDNDETANSLDGCRIIILDLSGRKNTL
jgi:hypothetical protein